MPRFAGSTRDRPLAPFFPYYGSKYSLARHYPRPQRDLVVEPFAGAAGYATWHNCRKALLVDRDPVVAGLWRYLIAVRPEEILALPELLDEGDCVDDHDLPQEARWLIGFWLNRGSAVPKKTRTAYSAREDRNQLNWGADAKARIASQVHRIREWKVVEGSYEGAPDVEATWFIDPPYGDKGRYYRCRFDDFPGLGRWCLEREGQVVVCEGPGADWLPFKPFGDFKSSKGRAEEVAYVAIHEKGCRRVLDEYAMDRQGSLFDDPAPPPAFGA